MTSTFVTVFNLAFLAVSTLAGCRREPTPSSRVSAVPSSVAPSDEALACAAQRELERLDTRAALPLLPHMAQHQKQNMREHLLAVQEIVLGLANDDFAAIERAGARLGSSPQMTQMCEHMGSGAKGFSERALGFHQVADGIASAARARDHRAVMNALGATLRACTSCHDAFQQRVVGASTLPHSPC